VLGRTWAGVSTGGLDQLALPASSKTECVVGDPIDVTKAAGRGLVEECDGVRGEEFLVGADAGEAETDVVGGVGGREGPDAETIVEAGVERAISAAGKALVEIGETDEDEREERL
jgi:hypothetical protein